MLVEHQRTHENSLVEHGGQRPPLTFDDHRDDVDECDTDDEYDDDDEDIGEDVGIPMAQHVFSSFQKRESFEQSIVENNNNNKCDDDDVEKVSLRVKREVDVDCSGERKSSPVGDLNEKKNDQDSLSKRDSTESVAKAKYSDTMRDFAPLFNIAGDDDIKTMNLTNGAESKSVPATANVSLIPTALGGNSSAANGNGGRSKRKGLPMKHVDSPLDCSRGAEALEFSDTPMPTTSGLSSKVDVAVEMTSKSESTTEEWDLDRLRNRTVSPGQEVCATN